MTDEKLKQAQKLKKDIERLKSIHTRVSEYLSKSQEDSDDSYYIDTEPLAYAEKIIIDNIDQKIKEAEKKYEEL